MANPVRVGVIATLIENQTNSYGLSKKLMGGRSMMVYSKYRRRSCGGGAGSLALRRIGIIFLVITTAVLLVLKISTWLGAQELFQLKEIKIEGTRFIKNTELRKYFEIDTLKRIFDIDLRAIEKQVREHPLVQGVQVSRRFPSTLIIKIAEKEPIAIVNNFELFAIDAHGQVLPKIHPAMLCDYPIISNLSIRKGQIDETAELNKILDLLLYLKKRQFNLYSRISEISYSKNLGVYFYLTNGAVPVLMGLEDLEKKGDNLLKVLRLLDKENKVQNFEYFDLRFAEQVIAKKRARS
jgi:cell division protein FtsQ